MDSLDEWYEKALIFERSRWEAIEEFRERKNLKNLGNAKKKPILDIPRWDPNAMEVDKHRKTRRCYNCGETGYLAVRCSKPRKERRKKVKIMENVMEDFSLGRE